jgi:hypothetical protein
MHFGGNFAGIVQRGNVGPPTGRKHTQDYKGAETVKSFHRVRVKG